MVMKINSDKVRELRLQRSWSQEKLAEQAGLNPRTVQRVEAEGLGSLRTRLRLAEVFAVEPSALDVSAEQTGEVTVAVQSEQAGSRRWSGLLDSVRDRSEGVSIYQMTLTLLVAGIFLAAIPAFFSLSRSGINWGNYSFGKPLWEFPAWWICTLSVWLLCLLPVLLFVWRCCRPWLAAYAVSALLTLLLGVWRLYSQQTVVELMTAVLCFAGLLLMLSLFSPQRYRDRARHLVYLMLIPYLFLWLFQVLSFLLFMNWFGSHSSVAIEPMPITWYANAMLRQMENLQHLIPLLLVVVMSLPRDGSVTGASGKRAALHEADGIRSGQQGKDGHQLFAGQPLREM